MILIRKGGDFIKLCKYCKQPGKYNSIMQKVLCKEHRDIQLNFRAVWEAISHIQLTRSR